MTNNHVIPDIATARASIAEFDYDEDDILYTVSLNPDTFFVTDTDLDFTIVACDPSPLPLNIEAIPLLRNPQTVTRKERVNIIQHPRGRRKELSLHDNKVKYIYDIGIRYTTDTEPGSSGSPVFNNEWDLVALHHAGWSETNGEATNEGIRISSIVAFLINRQENESDEQLESLVSNIPVTGATLTAPGTPSGKPARPGQKQMAGGSLVLNLEGNLKELTIRLG